MLLFRLGHGGSFCSSKVQPAISLNIYIPAPKSIYSIYTTQYQALKPVTFSENTYPWSKLDYDAAGGTIASSCVKGFKRTTYSMNLAYFNLTTIREGLDSFSLFVKSHPSTAMSGIIFEVFGQQRVLAVDSDASAYPHRKQDAILALMQFQWSDEADTADIEAYGPLWRAKLAKTSGYTANMHQDNSDRDSRGRGRRVQTAPKAEEEHLFVYQNYAHGDEPLEALYGYEAWRLERLRALKRKYDPLNKFKGYHNVVQV